VSASSGLVRVIMTDHIRHRWYRLVFSIINHVDYKHYSLWCNFPCGHLVCRLNSSGNDQRSSLDHLDPAYNYRFPYDFGPDDVSTSYYDSACD
jgi:hypothetical protein